MEHLFNNFKTLQNRRKHGVRWYLPINGIDYTKGNAFLIPGNPILIVFLTVVRIHDRVYLLPHVTERCWAHLRCGCSQSMARPAHHCSSSVALRAPTHAHPRPCAPRSSRGYSPPAAPRPSPTICCSPSVTPSSCTTSPIASSDYPAILA